MSKHMKDVKNLVEKMGKIEYKLNEPASRHTTFRIGGPISIFAEPADNAELATLIHAAEEMGAPYYVIGNGSNLLVSDDGLDALVIKIGEKMSAVCINDTKVYAQAGALFCSVAKSSVSAGLKGLEWAAGIPGFVGGAVAMNAGAYGGEISRFIKKITIYKDGEVKNISVSKDDFGYRYSAFSFPGSVVLSAEFELCPDDGTSKELMEEYNTRRKSKQPLELPSAGSTFKRPEGHFAGQLIEQAGLKGRRVGGAMVSSKHAGFIVNAGGATSDDVIKLIDLVKAEVFNESGIVLEPEIRILR